jgi:hypothetical protein
MQEHSDHSDRGCLLVGAPGPHGRSRISTMSTTFSELPWHDAVILSIWIDRCRPGAADEVIIAMLWSDERRTRIRFFGCYGLEAKLNFGIVAGETVRAAMEIDDIDSAASSIRSVARRSRAPAAAREVRGCCPRRARGLRSWCRGNRSPSDASDVVARATTSCA